MSLNLQSATTYLNALSLRERILALIVLIAVIYIVFNGVIFQKLEQHYAQLQNQQQQLLAQQQQFSTVLVENTAKLAAANHSEAEIKNIIHQTQLQIKATEQSLKSVFNKLVPPQKITELLRNLLLQTSGLKLVSLSNEPVNAISFNDNENNDDRTTSESVLYEHATIIKLTGNYQQLYQYLLSLEQSDWGLFWDKLQYKVTEYPQADITLRVYTISTDKHWIGL